MLFVVRYSACPKLQIDKIENYNIAENIVIIFSANNIQSEKNWTLS